MPVKVLHKYRCEEGFFTLRLWEGMAGSHDLKGDPTITKFFKRVYFLVSSKAKLGLKFAGSWKGKILRYLEVLYIYTIPRESSMNTTHSKTDENLFKPNIDSDPDKNRWFLKFIELIGM